MPVRAEHFVTLARDLSSDLVGPTGIRERAADRRVAHNDSMAIEQVVGHLIA
jgi:hypothetical protein